MATKKKAAKKNATATLNPALIFKREWIFDPGPEFLRLSKAATIRINQLKTQFIKQVNGVISKG